MKKSEAVNQLIKLIPEILDDYEYSVNYADSTPHKRLEWLAESILNKIENHGIMVPPETQYWNKDKNGKLQYSQHNGDYLNVWEKEE